MRVLLTLITVAAVLGVALFLWSNSERTPALESATPASLETSTSKAELAPLGQSGERQPSASRNVFGDTKASPSKAEIRTLPSELVLEGEVLITEKDGTESRATSGRVHLTTWLGERGNGHVVQIKRGRWRLRFVRQDDGTYQSPDGGTNSSALPSARIIVSELFLSDPYGETSPADTSQEFPFGLRDATIRVSRLRSLTLRVEDARNGTPLDHVSIQRVTNSGLLPMSGSGWSGPEASSKAKQLLDALVTDVSAPIRLTSGQRYGDSGQSDYWVGSPGYGWKRLGLDLRSDGERVIPLERAGILTVSFEGTAPAENAFLRIRTGSPESLLIALELADSKPKRIEGLAPGRYSLQLETGDGWSVHRVWARATMELAADVEHEQILRWGSADEGQKASLAGTLIIPAEWNLERFTLTAQRFGGQSGEPIWPHTLPIHQLRKLGAEAYGFQFDQLLPGEYQLSLEAVHYAVGLTLPASGLRDFRFEIPPPAEIKLRLLEGDTDSEVVVVQWMSAGRSGPPPVIFPPQGLRGESLRQEGDPFFHLRVPQGKIVITRLQTIGADYVLPREPLLANPGTEHTLHLRRALTAKLILLDGETRVPWPSSRGFHTSSQVDGEGTLTCIRGMDGQGRARADRPGLYRVELPTVPGFAAHAPVEIEIVEGEIRELEIQLVRSR